MLRKFYLKTICIVGIVWFSISLNGMWAKAEGEEAANFAMNAIKTYIASENEIISWSNETEISNRIVLYAPDNMVTGYIFQLAANGKANGFIQIQIEQDGYNILNFGSEGDDLLTGFLKKANIDLTTLTDKKVYYCGNFDYFLCDSNGKIIDLNNQAEVEDISILQEVYDIYKASITKQQNGMVPLIDSEADNIVLLKSFSGQETYLRTTSYFANNCSFSVTGHCVPTACTNMVLYWINSRGITNATGSSDIYMFEDLYNLLWTNDSGTLYLRIMYGLRDYLSQYYASSQYTVTSDQIVTLENIKNSVRSDCSVQMTVKNWGNSVHDINVWGYSGQYLYISDNNQSIADNGNRPQLYMLNFNNYNYYQAIYLYMRN